MAEKSINSENLNWKDELKKTAFRYHVIVAWVAVVLNPIWVIPDYFNLPDHFNDFLIFRIAVSIATLIGILLRHKFVDHPSIIAFIPFLGISIQNAYMYSVMDGPHLEKHTFAYIALFIGAGMFVLWKMYYSIIIVVCSFIANIIFFYFFSHLGVDEVLLNGGFLTASVATFTILLINTRTSLTRKEIIARLALAESNKQLEIKNVEIAEKNKDINDSINYALRIQEAILPSKVKMDNSLKDYFIYYQPKDVISGDFYWFSTVNTNEEKPKKVAVIAAVDCTGHGVPGALMSIIGSTILNQTTVNAAVNSPADALTFLNRELNNNLKSIKDGMDIALAAIDFENMQLQYAGAHNALYIVRDKQLTELKPDKLAIAVDSEHWVQRAFTNHVFDLKKGDCLYLFTDGFADQFGGPKGKKFTYKRFQELLLDIHQLTMDEQNKILTKTITEWKGSVTQTDDNLVIGIKI